MKISSIQLAVFTTLFSFCSGVNAQIEKWVDEAGNTHYGSYAPAGVESKPVKNAPITSPLGTSPVEFMQEDEQGDGDSLVGLNRQNFDNSDAATAQRAILYSTSWCGYCKKARAYMKRNGVAYVEFDIESNRNARAEYLRYKGKGVPFLVMGTKTLRGFSSERYNRFFK